MSRAGTTLLKALGIALVVAVFGGFVWLIVRGIDTDPGLVGALATAASAVIAVVVGRHLDRKQELQQKRRELLEPFYKSLVERIRNAEQHQPEDMVEFFKQFSVQLILSAPSDLIKAWIELSRHEWPADGVDPEGFLLYEQVLREIRKDLGHNDSKLGPGDLQRLYVNDLDHVLGPFTPKQTNRLAPAAAATEKTA